MTILASLEKLTSLKEKGLLTQAEFEEQKQILLEQTGENATDERGFWEFYLVSWKKFCTFSGRASRTEFFAFSLVNAGIGFTFGFLSTLWPLFTIVSILFSVMAFIPGLAVYTRRFHDIGKSAWFAFTPQLTLLGLLFIAIINAVIGYATQGVPAHPANSFLFIIGMLVLLVLIVLWSLFLLFKGTKGPNKYGLQPAHPQEYIAVIFWIVGTVMVLLFIATIILGAINGYQKAMLEIQSEQALQVQMPSSQN